MHIDGGLRWAIGSSKGAITQKGNLADLDAVGTLGCGTMRLGRAASGHLAVATAAGTTFIYDTADLDAGPTSSVPFLSARVRRSADGRLLAARGVDDQYPWAGDMSLRIFSLPDGAEVASLVTDASLLDFSLSSSGTTLGRAYLRGGSPSSKERIVSDVTGETVFYQETGPHHPGPVISPDGHHFLLTDDAPENGCGYTQFFDDGVLVNAVPGCGHDLQLSRDRARAARERHPPLRRGRIAALPSLRAGLPWILARRVPGVSQGDPRRLLV